MYKTRAAFFWSGGKDSALALYRCLQDENLDVYFLVSTFSDSTGRLTMHGIRRQMVEAQAEMIDIPLLPMMMKGASNAAYESAFKDVCDKLKRDNVTHIIYGDIFLEDLKIYREDQLKKEGMKGIFPLWKESYQTLKDEYISTKINSIIVAADSRYFDEKDLGKKIDKEFLEAQEGRIDPFGENGEYHSFCLQAPFYYRPVKVKLGERTFKTYETKKTDCDLPAEKTNGFWFLDILPA